MDAGSNQFCAFHSFLSLQISIIICIEAKEHLFLVFLVMKLFWWTILNNFINLKRVFF